MENSKLPSIMRTVTPSQSATPASISERAKSVAQSVKKSIIPEEGGIGIIKLVLIGIGVILLLINLWRYYQYTDKRNGPLGFIAGHLGIYFKDFSQGTKAVVNTVAEGTKDTVSIAQNVTDKALDAAAKGGNAIAKRSESPIERQLDEDEKKEEEAENINPTSAYASNLKKSKKGGFCYIGTDRTYRSCVKVDKGDTCMSGQIFPTKDICINPNLRR